MKCISKINFKSESMKRFALIAILSCSAIFAKNNFNILHLSFHQGCINDFQEVIKHFPAIQLTSWNIESNRRKLDAHISGDVIYNMSHDRAHRIWLQHADYFNSFDMIATSDTAPLSRIFLQNNWHKPLPIWVCNRFDYFDGATHKGTFPDHEYYELMRNACHKRNVKIISYTPYEFFYAR